MSDTTTRTGIEQGRASKAYDVAVIGTNAFGKDYTSYVKKLPMLIKTNGLGASIIFYAGNKEAHKMICEHILEWLNSDSAKICVDFLKAKTPTQFASEIVKLESSEYRMITIEVLAFLNWLKRFSTGLKNDA